LPTLLGRYYAVWLRHSKKYVFMGHRCFLGKKHPYRAMDCQFNGEKENREVPLHVAGDLVHLKVKDVKTIKELPKLTEKPLAKERNEMVKKKKKECGTRNQFYESLKVHLGP
jgi:hypothetical protein